MSLTAARRLRRVAGRLLPALSLAGATMVPVRVPAQANFYNTDRGRPLQIEDAYAVDRYAFDLRLAPVRIERGRGGAYSLAAEPELAFGILPRTQLEIGVPLAYVNRPKAAERVAGAAGVELSLLYNLNTETATLPALAVAADVVTPGGPLGPEFVYPSVKGIATRTYRLLRVHVNGQYTYSDRSRDSVSAARGAGSGVGVLSRWLAGVAVDRALPLRSLLVGAEGYARQPLAAGSPVQWNAGLGLRYQLTPRVALDAGAGARLTGDNSRWFFTLGSAYAFGLPALMATRPGQ